MAGGRPREITPEPEELVKLGEEMLAWCKEHRPYHLSYWYTGEKGIVWEIFKRWREKPEFRPYYEQCQIICAEHLVSKNSNFEPNLKNRFARLYFKDMKEDEDELVKLKAQAAKEAQEAAEQISTDQLKSVLQKLKNDLGLSRPDGQSDET